MFAYVKKAIWSQISSWNRRFLSRVGKENLLKMVAQTMLNYVMSVFLLPELLCGDLGKMMNSYRWGLNVMVKEVLTGFGGNECVKGRS